MYTCKAGTLINYNGAYNLLLLSLILACCIDSSKTQSV